MATSCVKKIAILSSGTDNSGINGAIRAAVRTAYYNNIDIYGVRRGFLGLVNNDMSLLSSRDVSGKIGKAGCFLGTQKPHNILTKPNIEKAVNNCKEKGIEGLVVIGGFGSLASSQVFLPKGLKVIGIPSTIQDDIPKTDISIGVDSAVNNISKCLDKIRASTSATNRLFLVQVEGRKSGSLALLAGITAGADFILTPENSNCDLQEVVKRMSQKNIRKEQSLAVISAGWKPGIDELARLLEDYSKKENTDLVVRKTILGYVQRGGSPSGYDRLLGTEMGNRAVKELMSGNSGEMVALQDNVLVTVPFEECFTKTKELDSKLLDLFNFTK